MKGSITKLLSRIDVAPRKCVGFSINPLSSVSYTSFEIEALANWAKGDTKLAKTNLELLTNDVAAPANYKQRATALIGLIDGGVAFKF